MITLPALRLSISLLYNSYFYTATLYVVLLVLPVSVRHRSCCPGTRPLANSDRVFRQTNSQSYSQSYRSNDTFTVMAPKGKTLFRKRQNFARTGTLNVTLQPIAGHAEGVMNEEEVNIVDGEELVRQRARLLATCVLPVFSRPVRLGCRPTARMRISTL